MPRGTRTSLAQAHRRSAEGLRIGLVPEASATGGGVYQYGLSMIEALCQSGRRQASTVLVEWPFVSDAAIWKRGCARIRPLYPPSLRRRARRLLGKLLGEHLRRNLNRLAIEVAHKAERVETLPDMDVIRDRPDARAWFEKLAIDLMIYPAPNRLSFEAGVPYVMTIHDLQHRLQPEFPEVSADGEWERREYLFRNGVRNAEAVIVDSEIGREDVLNCYGSEIAPDRIEILPYVPAPYLMRAPAVEVARIRDLFGLQDRFLLFPAQFWPHKNHVRLIEAVQLLRDSGRAMIQVVMTGSATSPIMRQVESQIRASILDKKLDGQFVLTGRLADSEMAAVYSGTDGVVLPTFFGPTNIPVVEAWALGIPVLTSDIRGIREQCGDAAILVDPRSAASIAEGLQTIWTDRAARSNLVKAGLARIESYGARDFAQRFDAILQRVEGRLSGR